MCSERSWVVVVVVVVPVGEEVVRVSPSVFLVSYGLLAMRR